MDFVHETSAADKRIRKYIRKTPLEFSPYLSNLGHCKTYLKLENIQLTGSFKIRGALNKLLYESREKGNTEFITASSGNHGVAFAYALDLLKLNGSIFLPNYASAVKIDSLKFYSPKLYFYGDDCVDTEAHAKTIANKKKMIYVSPYNDEKIIAGQATIAIELKEQLEELTTILVPIGGGGLISGIAGYIKQLNPEIEIIGCLPENSPVMYESVKEGKIITMESKPTLSDGTAGGIETDSLTFDFCRKLVDDYILVSEDEIKEAIIFSLEKHNQLIEGAAALSIAAFMKENKRFKDKFVVLIVSGGKISLETLKEILI